MAIETANTTYQAGQFLTGSLKHFTVTAAAGAPQQEALQVIGTRATIVEIGVLGGATFRVALENSSPWDVATLDAAFTEATVAATSDDFAY